MKISEHLLNTYNGYLGLEPNSLRKHKLGSCASNILRTRVSKHSTL